MPRASRINEEGAFFRREVIEYLKRKRSAVPTPPRSFPAALLLPPLAALVAIYAGYVSLDYQPRLNADLTAASPGHEAMAWVRAQSGLLEGVKSGDELPLVFEGTQELCRFRVGEGLRGACAAGSCAIPGLLQGEYGGPCMWDGQARVSLLLPRRSLIRWKR